MQSILEIDFFLCYFVGAEKLQYHTETAFFTTRDSQLINSSGCFAYAVW